MHNKHLADQRNIPQEDREKIDELHLEVEMLVSRANLGVFDQSVYDKIEELEDQLQALWQFSIDPKFHRYKHDYKFKSQWVGKKYRCLTTGEVFTIPETIRETDFFSWGCAFVDIGRLNCYSRFSNCEEIKTNE